MWYYQHRKPINLWMSCFRFHPLTFIYFTVPNCSCKKYISFLFLVAFYHQFSIFHKNELRKTALGLISVLSYNMVAKGVQIDFLLINWLVPKRCGNNFKCVVLKLILQVDILSIPWKIGFMLVSEDPIDVKSSLVQGMAWFRQATSH